MNTAIQSTPQVIGQPNLLSSLRSKLSSTEPLRAFFTGIAMAVGLAAAIAAPALASTDGADDAHSAALEKWRAVMAENPPQEPGCFRESYPSLVREKVDCYSGPQQRIHPVHRKPTDDGLELVGQGNDWIAETKGKTFWAGGSFLDVSVGSEVSIGVHASDDAGNLGPNEYTLQLNTNNDGKTSACKRATTSNCHVWQQFVYATDYDCGTCGTAGVFIQFWLLNYGTCPNSAWTQYGEDCAINSAVASAPDFPATDLARLSLHGSAKAGGQDCVVVYDDTGAGWGACASDGVLDISSVWYKTEFGIFGDGGGSEAQFSFGTKFAQLLQVNEGSGSAPACHSDSGTTGETNNLTLGKTCEVLTGNGLYPRISFTESNLFGPPTPPTLCGEIFPGQGLTPGHSWQSCDKRFTLAMQTDSNLVLYEGDTALWATSTVGQDVAYMVMQADGNLVLYDTSENAVWNRVTAGYQGSSLTIQNDGNLVIYYPGGQAIWPPTPGATKPL